MGRLWHCLPRPLALAVTALVVFHESKDGNKWKKLFSLTKTMGQGI